MLLSPSARCGVKDRSDTPASVSASWGKCIRIAAVVFAFLMAALPTFGQDFSAIDKLEGWWAYQDGRATPELDCRDPDGQYRVAIGRFQYDDVAGTVIFGEGEERAIAFYENNCVLATPMVVGTQVAAAGECRAEGEVSHGIVTFETIDDHTVRVTAPNMRPNIVLSRCKVESDAAEAELADENAAAAQDGLFTGPLLIPAPTMEEFFVDDLPNGRAQNAPQAEDEVPADIRAALENANRPFEETDIHEFCRAAKLDRKFGYRLGAHVEHEPVTLRIIADELSRRDKRLFGRNTLRMGAYVGTVYVEVNLAGVHVPPDTAKGDAVVVEGTLGRNEFWANLTDACSINIVAEEIALDGF